MEGCNQQLFALTKNPKYVKMRLPKPGRPSKIEQYCKRRKDRMKPKRQEDSSCVFAYYFVAVLADAAIPQEKKERRNRFGADQEKKFCKKPLGRYAGKSFRERQAPALYAAVRVRRRSYGVSHILRSVTGRITGHRRSLPQPSSAAWCPPPLHRSRACLPHVAVY